jgi:cyclophilin family peptidyl-prolyl cis-trans isomerase
MQENVLVFFDVRIGERSMGRMIFELFMSRTPRTCENFRQLCLGHSSTNHQRTLHYQGCAFHRVIKGFMAQGGDITRGDGTGGMSIYGKTFNDENFSRKHTEAGLLSMANAGPNTNSSQFFITFAAAPHLDGRHCVFGRLVKGMEVLKIMEMAATDRHDTPLTPVVISSCGEVRPDQPTVQPREEEARNSSRHTSSDKSIRRGGSTKSVGDDNEGKTEVNEDEEEKAEMVAAKKMEGMSGMEKRLFQLKMKMNQGRKANNSAVEKEYHSKKAGKNTNSGNLTEYDLKKQDWKTDLIKAGIAEDEWHLLQTTEEIQAKEERTAHKKKQEKSFGWNKFNSDAQFRSYDQNIKRLQTSTSSSTDTTGGTDELMYGKGSASCLPLGGAERISKFIEDKESRAAKKRKESEAIDKDVDFINRKNERHNKNIASAYDKYTVDIRQNLERGTAL